MKRTNIFYEEKNKLNLWDIPIGILFFLSFLSIGLLLAIHFRPLYYLNINWLDLEASSGFSKAVIRENYDALIDYCSPFFTGDLAFPSLQSSVSGISHFAEVKVIFNVIYITGFISSILCVLSIVYKRKRREYNYLIVSSVTGVVLPVLLGIACLINFNAIFTLFHKLVFSNNDWMFDPETDPIIKLLPEAYFMQCAFIIMGIILIGCLTLYLFYYRCNKNKPKDRLIPRKINYYY